jgi:agmatine deiminase
MHFQLFQQRTNSGMPFLFWPLPLVLFLVLAAAAAVSSPGSDRRVIAEWEPAAGTLIAWPLEIPDALVVELAKDDEIYVLVSSEDAGQEARRKIIALGVADGRVHVIPSSVQSCWPRDYGSHQLFDARGILRHLDPIYIDTPEFPADPEPIHKGDHIKYPNAWPGDDRTNGAVAAFFDAPLDAFPGFLTGGNFLVDGQGTAFSTRALLDENLVMWNEDEMRALVRKLAGIDRWVVLGNTEDKGIQHIDCWLKVLDEETLLVKRAPADHPEAARIERNLETLRGLSSAFGRPYRIVRIDCPRYKEDRLAAYTNSLILNRKVLVPLFGIPADDLALAIYRQAMPGYDVKGFVWDRWWNVDAVHCRTRAMFDKRMLHLTHARLRASPASAQGYEVFVTVEDMSRAGLLEDGVRVFWRQGSSEWARVALHPSVAPGTWSGEIPRQPAGSTIEYYVEAASRSGRTETLPRTAPRSFYAFDVVDGSKREP